MTVQLACERVAALLPALPAPHAWLSGGERERLAAIATASRRDQFLAARWLARQLLAGAAGGAPQDWVLTAPPDAPPAVEGHSECHLSISHSGEWVACALGSGPLGLDLEAPRRARDIGGLVELCCTQAEQRLFDGLHASGREALFYELWTVKEGWLKRRREWIAPSRLGQVDAAPDDAGEVRTWTGEGWRVALCAAAGEVRWWGTEPVPSRAWRVADLS